LPKHKGYGYLASYDDTNCKTSWKEVVVEHLERSRSRIRENKIFDWRVVDRVEALLANYDNYFEKIEPIPFLDDISTKNVLINNGRLSGIIDLDWLCFGDSIYIIAMTKMALLSMGADTDYIDYWMEAAGAGQDERDVLELYTLIFCIDFMGEKGMRFNKEEAPVVSENERKKYEGMYKEIYGRILKAAEKRII
jgi:hypothetical protein